MIHVFITKNPVLRDAAIEHFQLAEKAGTVWVYQKSERILLWDEAHPESLIERAFGEFAAERVWLLSDAHVISTEHDLGDIVLPNTFLMYESAIEEANFTKDNRDNFLHDALFLSHYDEQSDLDFETFGLSIGGITVTKLDGMENVSHEQIDFAYSADCIDPIIYPLILAAKKIDRAEDVYPTLAIVGANSTVEEQTNIFGHLFHVIEYLQAPVYTGETLSLDFDDAIEEDEENEWPTEKLPRL